MTATLGDRAIHDRPDPAGSRPGAASSGGYAVVNQPWTGHRLFTEHRLGLCATGVALGYALALTLRLARHNWWLNPDGKACTDFVWIWLSSKFAIWGELARAYDYPVFAAARAAAGFPNCIIEHFDYPPTLLFYSYPIGLLPYSVAFATWTLATLVLYLATIYTILPRRAAVIAALTISPIFFNVLLGHNGFLSAGFFGLALAFMERRPWLSGIFVGLLTYKPQFGILFPFALLAARKWRVLLAAAATGLALAVAAAIAFGSETWPAFVGALVDRASSVGEAPQQALTFALVSIFGVARTTGAGADAAWIVQFAVTACVALAVCALWARPTAYALQAASLAVGSLLASPHVYGYDYCILAVGVAFLVKDGLARGFLLRERGAMLACWAALFLFSTGPPPAIVCTVLLILVIRRARRREAQRAC